MKKAALHNLGCKVNAYETEAMQQMLEEAGYEIVPFSEKADVYVINTCSVTNMADRKSRQMLHRAKKRNPDAAVVAAGCYVQTKEDEAKCDEAIDILIGNNQKKELVERLDAFFAGRGEKVEAVVDINHEKQAFEELTLDHAAEHTRAFIKVQDGCNQFCSYCIIPYARGRVRSRKPADVLDEIQRLAENGYQEVKCPQILDRALWEKSGHWANFKDNMFTTESEKREFAIKPMNCPGHIQIFNTGLHSYRELPLRYGEFGSCHRNEPSGALHGIMRVRGFTQDDAHMFVRPDQLLEEFEKVIDIVLYIFKTLKFDNYTAQISLRDPNNKEKYIGSDENWEKAESAIIQAAKEKGLNTVIEYGEAAFYGPKLDFMVRDAIGRKWQLGTIQVDYNLPERFDLTYKGADDKMHRPIMIHRAPFGSMERFVAVLLEHTGGKFPLWLSPDQVVVLPISEKFNDYAEKVSAYLNKYDIRSQVDDRNEKIGRKIRDNELKRIPYLLIVGEKEEAEGLVSVRAQGEGDKGQMTLEAFRDYMTDLVSHEIDANKMEQKN